MTYRHIAEMAEDIGLRKRLQACVASLELLNGDMWFDRYRWQFVAGEEWQAAWATAEDEGVEVDDRGWSGAVVTDAMILQAVQRVWVRTNEGGN